MSKRNREKRQMLAGARIEPRSITPDELRREYERLEVEYDEALRELERVRANANALKGALQLAGRFVTMAAQGKGKSSAGQAQPDPLQCAKTGHVEGEGSN